MHERVAYLFCTRSILSCIFVSSLLIDAWKNSRSDLVRDKSDASRAGAFSNMAAISAGNGAAARYGSTMRLLTAAYSYMMRNVCACISFVSNSKILVLSNARGMQVKQEQ